MCLQSGTDDGQRHGQTDANGGPHVRRGLLQEPANADALSFAGQYKVQRWSGQMIDWIYVATTAQPSAPLVTLDIST